MTRERFEQLIRVTGPIAPEGMEAYIGGLSCAETELLPKEVLQFTLDWNHVPLDQQAQLMAALDAANAVPELVELSRIMARDAVKAAVKAIEDFDGRADPLRALARYIIERRV